MKFLIYSIAGLKVKCEFKYDKMKGRSERYSLETTFDSVYSFEISEKELNDRMGLHIGMPNDQNEVVSSAQIFFEKAILFDRLLLHAVVVVVDGYAYLFFAPPSGGKSTLANNWKNLMRERAFIIADDSPIIGLTNCGVCVWNSCWSKITEELKPKEYLLRGIGIIKQSETNKVIPIATSQAVNEIILGYPEGECRLKVKSVLQNLVLNVKCWKCYCDKSEKATNMIIDSMIW